MTRPKIRAYVAPHRGAMLLLGDVRAILADVVSVLWSAEHYPTTQRVVRGGAK